MKKLIYTLFAVLLITPIFAQNSSEAKSLLDKVSANYQTKSSMYLKFSSVLENTQAKTKDSYNGEVYIKGNQYNLTVPKMDIKQIYDGKKLYTIATDQQEVTVTSPEANSDELFTPTRVLEMYKKGYTLSMDQTKKVNGRNVTFVKLVPTDKASIKHILVGVDKTNNELVQMVETNTNNTTTTITVEKQLNDIIVPKSLLSFNKAFYKDFYISEI